MRPRLTCGAPHSAALLCVAAALAVAVLAPGPASAGAGSQVTLSALDQQTLTQINDLRLSYGLRPLVFSPSLFESASIHDAQMLTGGYFGHRSPDGETFTERLAAFYPIGAATYYAVGENLLWGSGALTSAQMVARWMQSPPHRRNLLNPTWRQIGVATLTAPAAPGVYDGLTVTVVTVDFGVRS